MSRESNQTISHVTLAMDRYSTSIEDRETVCCFLDFQEIKESPINTQKPLTDFLVSGHAAQSKSTKAFGSIEEEDDKKNTLTHRSFDVAKYLLSSFHVWTSWPGEKLTQTFN